MRGESPSIAQLISLTLATVAAPGCASDIVSNTEATTDASMDTGTSTGGSETDTNTSYGDTYDPTDYNPCAGWDPTPIVTDINVVDWIVTAFAYDNIRTIAENLSQQSWDLLDDVQRCVYACAYAATSVDALDPNNTYASLLIETCELTIPTMDADGVLQCSGFRTDEMPCEGGRAPLGWHGPQLAERLDAMATMEAVSITAFDELAAQLERLAAPPELIDRCRTAARDEARHLALLEQLGGRGPTQLPTPAPAETSTATIALHNAVEGCVHETWAALLAHHQAQHAADARTREVFASIADDETQHAQLAWDLHAWLIDRLAPAERTHVEAVRLAALDRLAQQAWQQALAVPTNTRRQLGLPEPRHAHALACSFGRQLAAAA